MSSWFHGFTSFFDRCMATEIICCAFKIKSLIFFYEVVSLDDLRIDGLCRILISKATEWSTNLKCTPSGQNESDDVTASLSELDKIWTCKKKWKMTHSLLVFSLCWPSSVISLQKYWIRSESRHTWLLQNLKAPQRVNWHCLAWTELLLLFSLALHWQWQLILDEPVLSDIRSNQHFALMLEVTTVDRFGIMECHIGERIT